MVLSAAYTHFTASSNAFRHEDAYLGIVRSLPDEYYGARAKIYPGRLLQEGMRGDDITDLQTYLSLIGRTYTEIPEIPVTGYFGSQTADAVRKFQELFGIPVSGVVGPPTWNAIANEYNAITLGGL